MYQNRDGQGVGKAWGRCGLGHKKRERERGREGARKKAETTCSKDNIWVGDGTQRAGYTCPPLFLSLSCQKLSKEISRWRGQCRISHRDRTVESVWLLTGTDRYWHQQTSLYLTTWTDCQRLQLLSQSSITEDRSTRRLNEVSTTNQPLFLPGRNMISLSITDRDACDTNQWQKPVCLQSNCIIAIKCSHQGYTK